MERLRRKRCGFERLEDRRLLAVFLVSTTLDVVNPSDGVLSLREAITTANSNGSSDVDEIILPSGQFTLTCSGTAENDNAFGDLDINTPVRILGSGPNLTVIDAGGDSGINERVFQTFGNHAITIEGLTIRGGRAVAASGADASGGAIFASGGVGSNVTLLDVVVTDNRARRQGGGIATATQATVNLIRSEITQNEVTAGDGGGIANTGALSVIESTLSGNTASGLGGGILNLKATASVRSSTLTNNNANSGGAITNYNGQMNVVNSTISGNQVSNQSGGIFNIAGGQNETARTTLLQSTVTSNQQSGSAAVHSLSQDGAASSVIRIGNSIITNHPDGFRNVGDFNFNGGTGATIISLGNNLSDDGANGRLNDPTDLPFITPSVIDLSLSDNGGPRQTHALLSIAGNPAIDGGDPALAVDPGPDGVVGGGDDVPLLVDGRGIFTRSFGGVDIGAFEQVTLGGADLVVTSTEDTLLLGDSQVTLRDAIEAANLQSGSLTIDATGIGGRNTLGGTHLEITDSVTINGPGQDNLTIDANQQSRIFNIEGDGVDVHVGGLTLTQGRTIGNNAGFEDSTFSGGAIRSISTGSLTISDSLLTNNRVSGAFARGGAVETDSGAIEIVRSTLSNNRADSSGGGGGAVHSETGDVTLIDSVITGNVATSVGGGVGIFQGDVLAINSTLSQNQSTKTGGGIWAFSGAVTLTDSTVPGNSTVGDFAFGGGIFTFSGAVTLTNSTVSGNSTAGNGADGGGLWFDDSTVRIVQSTITGNVSSARGGGIGMLADNFNDDERLTIHNSMIAGNQDSDADSPAPDFVAPGDPENDLEVRHSLIGNTSGTSLTNTADGNLLGVDWTTVLVSHTVDGTVAPLLADNGGPTQTHALLDGSPAIDAGDDALAVDSDGNPLTTDQRGAPFVRISDGTVDIGAYEQQALDQAIVILLEGNQHVVRNQTTELFRSPADSGDALVVDAGAGNDSVTIDFGSGFTPPPGGLSVQGNGGQNVLNLLGAGTLDLTDPNIQAGDFPRLQLDAEQHNDLLLDTESVRLLDPAEQTLAVRQGALDRIRVSEVTNWRIDVRIDVTVPPDGSVNPFDSGAGDERRLIGRHQQSGEQIDVWTTRYRTNFLQTADVDNSGRVEAVDALAVINTLNRGQRVGLGINIPITDAFFDGAISFGDANADGGVSPADALAVINALNRQLRGQGEQTASQGEQAATVDQAIWSYFHNADSHDDEDAFEQLRYEIPFLP